MSPSDILRGIRYHAPRIRPFDSAVGLGLGALGGLGVASVRDALGSDEEKDNKRYWTHALGGAALGFGGANLVGDRARRYLSNNLPPFSYGSYDASQYNKGGFNFPAAMKAQGVTPGPSPSPTDFLKPRSWQHFWNTAIADRPSEATVNFLKDKPGVNLGEFGAKARMELLRRHMNLPVKPNDAVFRSTGKRWFQPDVSETGNVISGGIPGVREHVEISPEAWKRYAGTGSRLDDYLKKTEAHLTTPKQIPYARTETVYPEVTKQRTEGWFPWTKRQVSYTEPADQPVERKVYTGLKDNPAYAKLKSDPWSDLFARHGTQFNPSGRQARVFDHWDFGLQPLESALLKQYLGTAAGGGTGALRKNLIPSTVRDDWDKAQVADSFGTVGKDSNQYEHMLSLLQRMVLNNVLGRGGVVFDQEFDFNQPGKPQPLYFNPRQTDVGLRYLPAAPGGG